MVKVTVATLAAATLAAAQRPTNTSMCDYYTTALFTDNSATNQYALVSAVVNRAVIGNMTSDPVVMGIVMPGTYNGVAVNLAPYFSGALNSTNHGGSSGVSVNFLDGGAATPLENGMPANNTMSNQYTLLTHLYSYFGALLGCSQYGMTGYPAYTGRGSQYEVHKYMGLDENMVGYFIEQVGLSAASFGVTKDDVTTVGTTLDSVFNVRCAPNTTVIPAQGAQQQSICIESTCKLAVNSTCSAYMTEPMPTNVTGTSSSSSGSNMTASSTGMPAMQTTNAAAGLAISGVFGAAALLFAL